MCLWESYHVADGSQPLKSNMRMNTGEEPGVKRHAAGTTTMWSHTEVLVDGLLQQKKTMRENSWGSAGGCEEAVHTVSMA